MRPLLLACLLLGCTTTSNAPPTGVLEATRAAMCLDEATCDELWGANTVGCNDYLDQCLQRLTSNQQREWRAAVERCVVTTSSCSARLTCYAAVPRC
jgi:hypothetical protein